METILSTWRAENVTSQPEAVSERARGYLVSISQYLEKVAGAVNQFSASASYSQTTVDGYRSSVSTARTNVNTAIVNLSTALQGLRTADNSLELALRELQLAQAPARSEDIAGQQARVTQAQAQLDGKQVSLGKTVLTSPIYAIVTRQDAKVGQSVTAQVPLVTLISSSQYEMEANVPEADIARLKVGQTAKVTLDAYSSDVVFDAHVTKIDPAETMIDGVPTYKVTFQFDKKDERLRSGMTANLDVLTEQKENVLAVPSRAVYSRDGKKYVRKYVHSTFVETEVVIGIRGSDGYVEVLSGLSEGELVENGSSTSLN